MTDLVVANSLRGELASVTEVDGALDVLRKAARLRDVSILANNIKLAIQAGEIMIEAAVATGEMLGTEVKQGDRTDLTSHSREKLQMPTATATKYRQIARIDPSIRARYVARCYEDLVPPSLHGLTRERHDDARTRATDRATEEGGDISSGITVGDFRDHAGDVEDGSVSLIFTDPPYDRKSVALYRDLGKFAADKLIEGGSLVTYLGEYALPEVCNAVLEAGAMKFVWPLACIHTGATRLLNHGMQRGLQVQHKTLLWFMKCSEKRERTVNANVRFSSCVFSEKEKDTHDWQQGQIEAQHYIEALSPPGSLVVDPFCGGGTTCVVAESLGRKWIAFEIDEVAAQRASQRIADAF